MYGQSLDHNEVLNVRWAQDDPNPNVIADNKRKAEEQFYDAARAKMPELGDKGDVFSYEGYYENPNNWQQGDGAGNNDVGQQQYQTPEEYCAAYAAWYAQHNQAAGNSSKAGDISDGSNGQQPVPPADPSLAEKSPAYQAAYWNWYYYMMNAHGGAPPPPGTVVPIPESTNENRPKKKVKATDSSQKGTASPKPKAADGENAPSGNGDEAGDGKINIKTATPSLLPDYGSDDDKS